MKPRSPTKAVTRTYVRGVVSPGGELRYQASVVIGGTKETMTATRRSRLTAVRAARKKAGIGV
jgi:hypothetical protein